MDSQSLRNLFKEYFTAKNHRALPASSLIPENDPSVLFTTAGMQQFKNYYLDSKKAPEKNITTCQPCFRTSDIDEVGDDSHLTFFEMLGNFSFGGYFKKEAISYAYDFLTKELEIDQERIHASVFQGDTQNSRDQESAEILTSMGLKFRECSRKDNFWGPTGLEGPCGPTVEFYIDGIEIWNLVFNEYYKEKEGSYRTLEQKGVDTGMGLERVLVVVNTRKNVYEIDVLAPIMTTLEEYSGKKIYDFPEAFRVISDHVKAAVFALNDKILPSNKERGYIVRRLIRRAIVKGVKLGIKKDLSTTLAPSVFKIYGDSYKFDQEFILSNLRLEENNFRQTLERGLKLLYGKKEISGQDFFDLYQSFGLPYEIVLEEAQTAQIEVAPKAQAEYQQLFQGHQELSRTASSGMFKGGLVSSGEIETKYHTATHLLLKALQEVLGSDVHQRGSNITGERLRFDFSYPEKLSEDQIASIETLVNQKISDNLKVEKLEMTLEEAKARGAEAQFETKYQDKVTVYKIGDFSLEACGGPHVEETGELGHFKITKEESSSSGVRRLKAVLE